jgi:flagellar assembly factor FliW
MQYETSRFGSIDVPDDKIIQFPLGLIGFEQEKKFVILKHKPTSSFYWLQSLNTPNLAFTLLFPFDFVPNYQPNLGHAELDLLQSDDPTQLEVYCMVVIPKDPSQMTINLLSPVVVYSQNKLGVQVVLSDSKYDVKHPLVPKQIPDQKQKPAEAS